MRDWKNTEAVPGLVAVFYVCERLSDTSSAWHRVTGEILESQRNWIRLRVIHSDSSEYEADREYTLGDDMVSLEIRSMAYAMESEYQNYMYEYGPARQYHER